jgi:hypothetical protein
MARSWLKKGSEGDCAATKHKQKMMFPMLLLRIQAFCFLFHRVAALLLPYILKEHDYFTFLYIIRRAQVKVGLINLCKGLFSLNAHIIL